MTPRRVLVTGGAGFIGSRLTRRLREQGHEVVVLDRLLPQVHGPRADAAGIVEADVRDADSVTHAMAGIEVVYHLAADTGVGQSQYEIARYVGTNVLGFAVVLQAAVEAGVQQVVLTSSRAVYGEGSHVCRECDVRFSESTRRIEDMDAGSWHVRCPQCGSAAESLPMHENDVPAPTSVYGATKLQQEQLAEVISSVYDLPVTILRFFNVFGPGQSLRNPYVGVLGTFLRCALEGRPVELYEDGQMRRDFVFIDDVVDALQSVMGHEATFGQPINVGTGSGPTLAEVATTLFATLGIEPKIEMSGRYRVGDVRHTVADTRRMQEILPSTPATSLADGMRAFAEWARANAEEGGDDRAAADLVRRELLRGGHS